MTKNATKFLVISEYAEILDLCMHLKFVEKQEVLLHVPIEDCKKIGDGIIEKTDDSLIQQGKGYIWVFDGCSRGKRQDWLRAKGELVIGGTEVSDKLENDRQAGQALFKAAGFKQPESKNFKSLDDALAFVKENKDKKYILKQNGSAPKSLNHKSKFEGGEDMIYHLNELKKKWNEAEMGKVDFDLMEVVEGLEVAASAFFNGKEFLKNKDGKVVGFLNFEEKPECDGGLGQMTGEMGTTFIGVTEDNPLFKEMIMRPKIVEVLKRIGYRGVFDINCIKTKDGMVALEPTSRFGVPATSYEFMEGLDMPTHELLTIMAKGEDKPISIKMGIGMVMVIAAKPFPAELHDGDTSLGEKLWILQDGKPIKDFTDEQRKHIHLENFERSEDENGDVAYRVATTSGYLLTVTGREGKTISEVRDNLIQYIKDNVYIAGMKYRQDIGLRVEEASGTAQTKEAKLKEVAEKGKKLEEEYENKKKEVESKGQETVKKIKDALKKQIYG